MDNNSSDLVYTIVTNQNGDISAADKRLLRQAYDDVYLPAFPEPEEQISFRKLCTDVKNSATVTLICAPGSLKPVIKALAIGYHYHGDASGPDVGLLGYLATDPHYQGQGLGKKMDALFRQAALEQAEKRGQKLGGIFLECNLIGTKDDVMDPATRIAMYKKWGAVEPPIFYKRPPLELGNEGIELRLLVEPNPKTGQYPTLNDIRTYLTGIYTESRDNLESLLMSGAEKSQAKAVQLRQEAANSPENAVVLNKRAASMDKRAAKMKREASQLPPIAQNTNYKRSMQELALFDEKRLAAFYASELVQQPSRLPKTPN